MPTSDPRRWLERISPWHLFFLSLASGFLWTWHFDAYTALGVEPSNLARSLVTQGTYSDPFQSMPTGSSAHMPPLFPLYLALIMKLLPGRIDFVIATTLINLVLGAILTILLPRLSRLLIGDAVPGIVAALCAAVLPVLPLHPEWEALMAACGLCGFILLVGTWTKSSVSPHRLLMLGVALGLLTLLHPPAAAAAALYTMWLWFRADGLRPTFARLMPVALMALLTISPWIWRNWTNFHAFVPMRSNAGLELYVANSDCAEPTLWENMRNGCHDRMHPDRNLDEARSLVAMGEVAYNRDRFVRARQWIVAHPARFLELTVLRVKEFWFPSDPKQTLGMAAVWLVTLISIPGLWLLLRRSRPVVTYFGAVSAIFPLVYYVVQISPRYRTPILWISLLCAGYAVTALLDSRRARA